MLIKAAWIQDKKVKTYWSAYGGKPCKVQREEKIVLACVGGREGSVGPTEPLMAFSCPGANPATVLQEPKNIWQKGGKCPRTHCTTAEGEKQTNRFLKAVEQRPDHVFAINPELP